MRLHVLLFWVHSCTLLKPTICIYTLGMVVCLGETNEPIGFHEGLGDWLR